MEGTGKARNVGLLQLYSSYLGDAGGKVTGVGLLVDSYVVMVMVVISARGAISLSASRESGTMATQIWRSIAGKWQSFHKYHGVNLVVEFYLSSFFYKMQRTSSAQCPRGIALQFYLNISFSILPCVQHC